MHLENRPAHGIITSVCKFPQSGTGYALCLLSKTRCSPFEWTNCNAAAALCCMGIAWELLGISFKIPIEWPRLNRIWAATLRAVYATFDSRTLSLHCFCADVQVLQNYPERVGAFFRHTFLVLSQFSSFLFCQWLCSYKAVNWCHEGLLWCSKKASCCATFCNPRII